MIKRFSTKPSLRDRSREELIILRNKFEKREEDLRREISDLESEIQNEFRQRFALSKATTETLLQSKSILREETNKAITLSEEHNYPFFGPYLLQAIEKPSIISVRLLGGKIHV